MTRCSFLTAVGTLLAPVVVGQLKILVPSSLASDALFEDGVLYGTTAVFGTPSYGQYMIGKLLNPEMAATSLGCASTDFPKAAASGGTDTKNFVVVRRGGGCTFARKTENAEAAGYDAVIVVDTPCAEQEEEAKKSGKLFSHCRNSEDVQRIIMANDGTGEDVKIPSVLVANNQGEKLIAAIKAAASSAAAAGAGEDVLGMLLWDLPRSAGGKAVKVDMWMSTGASDAMNFLSQFREAAATLGEKLLQFTPHFYIIETQLKLPGCVEGPASTNGTPRRYFCDPQMSSDAVVREDLRQLCLFRKSKSEYWKYLGEWLQSCSKDRSKLFDDKCSNGVLEKLRMTKPETDTANCHTGLLAEQAEHRAWSSHALQINGWRYSGPLDADAVTRTICAAFAQTPDECDEAIKDKMPTIDRSSHFLRNLLWTLLLLAPLLALAAWAYKFHVKKSLYRSLREEVMLEVRAQIQDYALLGDNNAGVQLKTLRSSNE